ncbi:MAG: 50S ribosomal protein L22 [archaeon]|jgi:ribosomal protein uL22|nr:50S ribosomal protein L22 [archaeon]MDD2477575.1 50S ribosomal protein L22 [Candidatus ainarchaeum sp.]MDD3084329.1 50S ribosomal protein L22 [Candidatus ainarchaeum sp.]MDD4221071.1 50S ribosomal protein L22 [Candidatus ainarchaeum sp.]MDD4662542.1 50S ribosomal protein L22 [Candidatus ainarchaeum sp.]
MTTINYNFQKKVDEKRIAKAYKSNAKISTKYSVEFCNYFNGMMLSKAIKIANDIKEKKDFLPLVKYRLKVAHRKGQTKRFTPTGRWPINVAKEVGLLLEDVKSNAEDKNLDVTKLRIIHMYANLGLTRRKTQPQGRIGGKQRESKSTNIEVIVLEE